MLPRTSSLILTSGLAILVGTAAAAQPVIQSLSSTDLPRSGRVAIEGFGFGSTGEVFISDMPAWTSTWTDERIVAYVPEEAALGEVSLYVVASGVQSDVELISVSERQQNGRVRWTFEADSSDLSWRPALAPDGTIYLHTNNATDGVVYALSPDGALLWIQKVQWYPYVPPSAGPDGALYVATINMVYRISPQGQVDWMFKDSEAQGIHVSPTIGPDGRLYGASDAGIGAFALDPASGQLIWSNPGNPLITDWGTLGTEMRFGPSEPGGLVDQLYFHMDGYNSSSIYAFGLDGEQRFTAGLAAKTSHEPAVGSDGTLYAPRYTGLWIAAFDPADGFTLWEYQPGWGSGAADVEIGPDDVLYYVGGAGLLEAFDPHLQQELWDLNAGVLGQPTISPDGQTLVVAGMPGYGQPGFVKAYEAATGIELWSVGLPGTPSPGLRILATDRPRFTPDGTTAYLSTYTVADGSPSPDPVSYLYALEIDDQPADIPCSDILALRARCTVKGTLAFGVRLVDGTHDGEAVTFRLDGADQFVATITNGTASHSIKGLAGSGVHRIELIDPAGCFAPLKATCE